MRITCAARTDIGIVRSRNDDTYRMLADRGVFMVADGMGARGAGGVASDMAARIVLRQLGNSSNASALDMSRKLRAAMRRANEAIFQRAHSRLFKLVMGTTMTAVVMLRQHVLIGHVGNSRAYLLRQGKLFQLTTDHTYVQLQVDAGLLTADRIRTHPLKKVLTRCLGARGDVDPDIIFGTLQRDDVLLIATDGLTRMLEDEDLVRILSSQGGPQRWVEGMIAEANDRGGHDNITAIAVHVESVGTLAHASFVGSRALTDRISDSRKSKA